MPTTITLAICRGKNPSCYGRKGKVVPSAIKRGRDHAFADMAELYLVPDVVIPPKFKVPNFDRYKGTTCPKNHLKVYYRKIRAYANDEKLLMHFFQESLYGVAVTWYTNLEPSRVHSWKDLMVAFLRQYQYNFDIIQIGCNYRTYAKRGTNLSKNTPKGEETWQC